MIPQAFSHLANPATMALVASGLWMQVSSLLNICTLSAHSIFWGFVICSPSFSLALFRILTIHSLVWLLLPHFNSTFLPLPHCHYRALDGHRSGYIYAKAPPSHLISLFCQLLANRKMFLLYCLYYIDFWPLYVWFAFLKMIAKMSLFLYCSSLGDLAR